MILYIVCCIHDTSSTCAVCECTKRLVSKDIFKFLVNVLRIINECNSASNTRCVYCLHSGVLEMELLQRI